MRRFSSAPSYDQAERVVAHTSLPVASRAQTKCRKILEHNRILIQNMDQILDRHSKHNKPPIYRYCLARSKQEHNMPQIMQMMSMLSRGGYDDSRNYGIKSGPITSEPVL